MAKRIIQGFIFALTLVALSSCAINQTFDKWDLRNEAAFEGESGLIGVVHASLSGACDSETGEIILYGPDGKKEQIDFVSNRLFASYLIPGTHKIEEVRYRCNYTTRAGTTINYLKWYFDSDNMFAKNKLFSKSGNTVTQTFIIHGSALVNVPEDGFCKFAVSPDKEGRWSGGIDLKDDRIAIDLNSVPSCQ